MPHAVVAALLLVVAGDVAYVDHMGVQALPAKAATGIEGF
jgi:hypothetical protein